MSVGEAPDPGAPYRDFHSGGCQGVCQSQVPTAWPWGQSWPRGVDCPLAPEPGGCPQQRVQSREPSLFLAELPPQAALSALPDGYQF